MAKNYIKITGQPELYPGKKEYSFRFRIPAHHGKPADKGEWIKTGTKKKSEALRIAEEWRIAKEEEINDWSSRSDLTLGYYARQWHERRTDEINALSFEREDRLIRDIEESDLGKLLITETEPDDIEDQKKTNEKAGWSKDKQRRYIQKVKQITKEASTSRKIKHDPGAPVKDVKAKAKERRAVPSSVIAEMLEALDKEEKSGKTAALRIAIGTGFRRGEFLGLQWGDIDLLHKTVNLQRQLNSKCQLVDPKYDSKGLLPIDTDLAEWLQEWKGIYMQRFGSSGINKAPVCCNEQGNYLNPNNFDRWRRLYFVQHGWGTYASVVKTKDAKGDTRYHRTGFDGYKMHEIRHYLATELLGSGADLRSTQAIMRHKRITTTEGYIHEIPENVRIAMQGIEKKQAAARGGLRYAAETRGVWIDEDEIDAKEKEWEEQQKERG